MSSLCSIRQTLQQFIYNLYKFFATVELKAYIMVVSAYKLHTVTSNDNDTKDFERVQAEHFIRMKNYLLIFSDMFHKSSTEIVACSTKFTDENNATQIKAINKLPKESDYYYGEFRNMEEWKYITFLLIIVISMVLSTPLVTTSESTSEEISMKPTILPLIKLSGLDTTDENIFRKSNCLLQMKTLKTISTSILDVFNNVKKSTVEKINSDISSVIKKLNETGINLYEESDINTISEVMHFKIPTPEIREDLKVLSDIMNDINYLFKNYYLEYLNGHTSNVSLQIFISKAMSLDDDGPGKSAFLLERIINSRMDGTSDDSFLETIVNEVNVKKISSLCPIRQTPQQFIYNLYKFFAIVELKAYIMVVSAYKLHAVTSNDNDTKDFERVQAEHFIRMKNYISIFSDILHKSSTEIVACSTESTNENIATQIKAINKLPKESNYYANQVVTGIRFVIENEVLHLQIEEGELISNGKILPGSEHWIPIDDMNYADRTINQHGRVTRMHQCIEYHSVTSSDYWYLDDIKAPPNFVVVGANFEVLTSESISNKVIYLRLKFAKVNITTSEFDVGQEQYSDDMGIVPPELRNQNLITDPKYVSLRKVIPDTYEYVQSYGNRRVEITPFINLQALYGNPRLPLMGIGTFNKTSTKNYSTYTDRLMKNNSIAFKVVAFDLSSLVDIN